MHGASLGDSVSKELTCNAGDPGSIPGSGRCPGDGIAIHSSLLALGTPWTQESGGLQSTGSRESDYLAAKLPPPF